MDTEERKDNMTGRKSVWNHLNIMRIFGVFKSKNILSRSPLLKDYDLRDISLQEEEVSTVFNIACYAC